MRTLQESLLPVCQQPSAKPQQQKSGCCLFTLFCALFLLLSLLSVGPWALACLVPAFGGAVASHLGIGEQAGPILVVTAHPDDESLFFGPTITALRNAQQEVFLLCMTTGKSLSPGLMVGQRSRSPRALVPFWPQPRHTNACCPQEHIGPSASYSAAVLLNVEACLL